MWSLTCLPVRQVYRTGTHYSLVYIWENTRKGWNLSRILDHNKCFFFVGNATKTVPFLLGYFSVWSPIELFIEFSLALPHQLPKYLRWLSRGWWVSGPTVQDIVCLSLFPEYYSTLAASAQIILFLELLKFPKTNFSKNKFLWRKLKNLLKYSGIFDFSKWNLPF